MFVFKDKIHDFAWSFRNVNNTQYEGADIVSYEFKKLVSAHSKPLSNPSNTQKVFL